MEDEERKIASLPDGPLRDSLRQLHTKYDGAIARLETNYGPSRLDRALAKPDEQTKSVTLHLTPTPRPRLDNDPPASRRIEAAERARERESLEAQIQMPSLMAQQVIVLKELLIQQEQDYALGLQIAGEQKRHSSRLTTIQILVGVGFSILGILVTIALSIGQHS